MNSFIPPYIPDSHLYRVTNTRCRIGIVFSPDDGHIAARNMYRKAIDIQEKLCTKLVLFTRLYKDARSTEHKKSSETRHYGMTTGKSKRRLSLSVGISGACSQADTAHCARRHNTEQYLFIVKVF